jgi:hypothetical protein
VTGGAIAASVPDTTNSPIDLPDSFTISFWFYPASYVVGYAYHPISKWSSTLDANYVIYFFGDTAGASYKNVASYANCGGVWQNMSGEKTLDTLNVWYHISWTYDRVRSQSKLYVNGTLVYNISKNCTLAVNNAPLNMGPQQNGKIDEVRIYNRALSDAEIKALYDATK